MIIYLFNLLFLLSFFWNMVAPLVVLAYLFISAPNAGQTITIEIGHAYSWKYENCLFIEFLSFIEITRSKNNTSRWPRLSFFQYRGCKFHRSFFQTHHNYSVQPDHQWCLALPMWFFFYFMNSFILIAVEKQIHNKWSRIWTHANSDSLLKVELSTLKSLCFLLD